MSAMMDSQKKHGDAHVLPSLELSNNLVGDPGAKAIARMIRKNTTVEHLLLNSNLLTDKGLAYIFEVAIKHNLKIRSLHVADNQISSKSAEELTKMLAGAPHEMTVDLSLNKLISRKGIATILSADVPMEFKEFYFIKKDRLQSTESSEYQAAAAPESAAGDEPGTETTE
jgi:Ran GTPase-activating protein (RanGAP) involved in mRNA processing and transport